MNVLHTSFTIYRNNNHNNKEYLLFSIIIIILLKTCVSNYSLYFCIFIKSFYYKYLLSVITEKTLEKAMDLTKFTSMVSESSEISTIFALKMSTNHMIWRL